MPLFGNIICGNRYQQGCACRRSDHRHEKRIGNHVRMRSVVARQQLCQSASQPQ